MLRTVAAALVAAAVLTVPAHADPGADTWVEGGCRLASVDHADVPDTAVLSGVVAVFSPRPAHNPVTVTSVRCVVLVDGDPVLVVDGATGGPFGVVPPTTFEYPMTDWVSICTEVTAVDAHGQQSKHECGPHIERDYVRLLSSIVFNETVDPALCPVLASLAPTQVQNHLRVDEQGDVYLAGELWWDCPPYQL